ncbi:hypothetical protein BACFIN_07216 [Bacteroides finegoldii DSM 17565]|nr:hypothetical protein BACFIN_07216 [Bacteroides finegoldii DSM 17565]
MAGNLKKTVAFFRFSAVFFRKRIQKCERCEREFSTFYFSII